MSARRLVLWDIDGTLLRATGTTRAALVTALGDLAGDRGVVDGVATSGRTDPEIAAEVLQRSGIAPGRLASATTELLAGFVTAFADGEAHLAEVGVALPGTHAALDVLAGHSGVLQTVLTGNVYANAVVKLRALGLARHLDLAVGAYGSDNRDRNALVPVALGRVRALRGLAVAPDEVWVIGDTPKDLRCARAAGVRCALVATGHSSVAQLSALGPDAVLPDLWDTTRLLRVLLGSRA